MFLFYHIGDCIYNEIIDKHEFKIKFILNFFSPIMEMQIIYVRTLMQKLESTFIFKLYEFNYAKGKSYVPYALCVCKCCKCAECMYMCA